MRPSEALAKHRDEGIAILAKYPVSNPRVFGSVPRGEDTDGSDLDILVEAIQMCPHWSISDPSVLGSLVDVSTRGNSDRNRSCAFGQT